uniref:Glycoprotein Ib platelet subunit beta n=1 Tax=Eptatretus burgeri TaxID=7764 RepID=A0A8C4QK08_EPTBU
MTRIDSPGVPSGSISLTLVLIAVAYLFGSTLPAGCSANNCPSPCTCTWSKVDCSSKSQASLPDTLPRYMTDLMLNNNTLKNIPPGTFDIFDHLEHLELNDNPWHCDCNIAYMRSWMIKNENREQFKRVKCSSPEPLRGRVIMYLQPEELSAYCELFNCKYLNMSQGSLYFTVIFHGSLIMTVNISTLYLKIFNVIIGLARLKLTVP